MDSCLFVIGIRVVVAVSGNLVDGTLGDVAAAAELSEEIAPDWPAFAAACTTVRVDNNKQINSKTRTIISIEHSRKQKKKRSTESVIAVAYQHINPLQNTNLLGLLVYSTRLPDELAVVFKTYSILLGY